MNNQLLSFRTLSLILVLSLASAGVSKADSIDTLSQDIGSIGLPTDGFLAQSFELTQASELQDVTFLFESLPSSTFPSNTNDSSYRVLVTEASSGGPAGFFPTDVHFESSTFTLPNSATTAQLFTVSLGATVLDAGSYAIVIDGFTSSNQGPIRFHATQDTAYLGGSLSFLDTDGLGDRSDYFDSNADWRASGNDLAFRLQFAPTAVPEPSSLILAGLGLAGLVGSAGLRRRSSTPTKSQGFDPSR